ncbi:glucuronate isomerase [Seonamhaeicola marinus]|uniref:Uronate isomerase n=1 Tax=Seonamhaeicola marinus TaxID=1912246 RepID=A0A5D0I6A1_9FLAO|nr:glucuronate isomerase [Seonamhaeicola marinus]TYA78360.1 glucuronate isomerase [Seonamhaeicola marinus]
MKAFLDDNFILETETACELFHGSASGMPIIDYHCHLIPKQIAENKNFKNLTELWLYGDHYKWRAMRTNGVPEKYCTGEASDWEKFEKWAQTVPYTLRNPLYHWTHMELKLYFGYDGILNGDTAKEVWDLANEKLQTEAYRPQGLLQMMNVEVVCTTDDPTDSLEYHIQIAESDCKIKVFPTWRPDKAMAVEDVESFNDYMVKLSEVSGIYVNSFDDLISALKNRHDFFAQVGCKLSDHGIEEFYAEDYTAAEIRTIFFKVRSGIELTHTEILKFKSAMMYEFGIMDHEKGWVQQFHYGAIRNNNTRLLTELGPDTGFDSIHDVNSASTMSKFLNVLDTEDKLAKTIIYNLNPAHNDVVATMIGNFQDGSAPGKMQFGSGWWFLDQKTGMENQMNALSNMGLLSRFVGMLTDSRCIISYSRHEYFRRILCNLLGNDVENGLINKDMALLDKMVKDICYYNAKDYFKFN